MTSGTLMEFKQLKDAEQYFEFFGLPYDPTAVNVNRLHILKQFSNSMQEIEATPDLSEAEQLQAYQVALVHAYELFLSSTGVEQKLFKVFKDKPKNVVMLSELTAH